MNNPVAVMDLGTNTFHLLIAEPTSSGYKELVHEENPVKLGEGGINKGLIQPDAFERGIECMERYQQLISDNNVVQVKAIATSALRNAANGEEFINTVEAKTGILIEVINGDAEAGYIYKGIKATGSLPAKDSLIVDIGGGSVEFIICNQNTLLWKQSFEIGAARLMDQFHQTDPIPQEFINELIQYLEAKLQNLFIAASTYSIDTIIGSSGVFESYASVIEKEKGNPFDLKTTPNYNFDIIELTDLIKNIIRSTHQQRAAQTAIISIRVDMIVTASILTKFIIDKLGVSKVVMSSSSLKEGVLAEMLS